MEKATLVSPFRIPVESNFKSVTNVILRAKLNQQSADRKLAKTNLLLEVSGSQIPAV
jgi:hypothetical protein